MTTEDSNNISLFPKPGSRIPSQQLPLSSVLSSLPNPRLACLFLTLTQPCKVNHSQPQFPWPRRPWVSTHYWKCFLKHLCHRQAASIERTGSTPHSSNKGCWRNEWVHGEKIVMNDSLFWASNPGCYLLVDPSWTFKFTNIDQINEWDLWLNKQKIFKVIPVPLLHPTSWASCECPSCCFTWSIGEQVSQTADISTVISVVCNLERFPFSKTLIQG